MLPIFITVVLLCLVDTSTSYPVTINFNVSNCFNSSAYARNSSYETNLNQLLSTLATNISTTKYGFIQHQQGSLNDPVYGIAWCRGDMTPTDCRGCMTSATKQVRTQCGRARQAILWKEQCLLRYSNYSFFGLLETQPNQPMHNENNITDNVKEWIHFLNQILDKVAFTAANKSGSKYATYQELFRPMGVLFYTMAQCMPELTKDNCTSCLGAAASLMQSEVLARGGIALTPVCTLRYEKYLFYDILSLGPVQEQSPHPALAPNSVAVTKRGKKKHTVKKLVAAIILVLAAAGMIIAIATYLLSKKKKKRPSQVINEGEGSGAT